MKPEKRYINDYLNEEEINMSNGFQIFNNPEFGEIRIAMREDQPWFVGKDIADMLGYQNSSKAVSVHVDSEDKLMQMIPQSQNGNLVTQTALINESGLYSLILSSKLPAAKKFKRWVTSEVLPQIRKTGGYVNDDELFIDSYLPYADEQTKLFFRNNLLIIKKQNEVISMKDKRIIELKERVGLLPYQVAAISNAISKRIAQTISNKDTHACFSEYQDARFRVLEAFNTKTFSEIPEYKFDDVIAFVEKMKIREVR